MSFRPGKTDINSLPHSPNIRQKMFYNYIVKSNNWCINLYIITYVYLLFSLTTFFPQWLQKAQRKCTLFNVESAWWESAYLWRARARALIKCRGRPIRGPVIMLEQRSNFEQSRLVIHHQEKQEAEREINNKYISQCLAAIIGLLGQATVTMPKEMILIR